MQNENQNPALLFKIYENLATLKKFPLYDSHFLLSKVTFFTLSEHIRGRYICVKLEVCVNLVKYLFRFVVRLTKSREIVKSIETTYIILSITIR